MTPNEQKLLKLLSSNDVTFFIPPYQRNYEWDSEQCDVFLDDIFKTCKRNQEGNNSEHFFGSITYFQSETPFGQPTQLILIDGQQRITTTMLFLIAVRDIIEDKEQSAFIDTHYLRNNSVSGNNDEYKVKLKQVETDWPAYKHLVLKEELSDSEKNAAVYRNYKFFVNKLTEYQSKGNPLISLIEKGLDKFSVITIELEPDKNEWENPQEIFESMNSLGKPLTLADLVRNYLLLGQNASIQEMLYNKYWLHIEETLPGQISNYIRDFMQWHAKTSFKKATETNYKELYSQFKDLFGNLKAETVLEKLSKYADIYAYILPGGKSGHADVDRILTDIQYFRVTTAYSFLLALLAEWENSEFSTPDIIDALDAFRIYCIRRRLLTLTTAENKVFPTLVNYIGELEDSTNKKEAMFRILARQESNLRLPNDVELTRYLETANFYNFQYCKFVLAMIEGQITKSRPDLTDKHLQIEHIMPQTLNEAWQKELGPDYEEVHQELVNTIGNLTLIRHNQELGNKAFEEKRYVYENKAGLQIAKTEITNHSHWDKTAINERAHWIISYLLTDVLPIPDSMRRTNNFAVKEHHGLSFQELQLVGETIDFIADPSITARVVNDKEVEFEGKKWRLSPLTREIQRRRGQLNQSEKYSGAQYWEYDGVRLSSQI